MTASVAESLELMLKSESFNPYITDLGHEAVELAKIYDYDIILLDLNLPDMSGYDVLRSLRVGKVKTPVLILSGYAGIEDKVRALGVGADDYVTKPFHKDELIARIHAIVRRSMGHAEATVKCGDLTVRPEAKQAEVAGRTVPLTGKEYGMLELLALRQGHTITKEMFLNQLYGGMDDRSRRSSTYSSASFARSSLMLLAVRTTSRACGAGGTHFGSPSRQGSRAECAYVRSPRSDRQICATALSSQAPACAEPAV